MHIVGSAEYADEQAKPNAAELSSPMMLDMASIFSRTEPDPREVRFEQLRDQVRLGIAQFRRTGSALKEIRDQELWVCKHRTWSDCCKHEWQITPQHAARLIDAADFSERIEPTGSVLPTSERQVRPLRGLKPEEQVAAWQEAAAEGATPAAIQKAVDRRRPAKTKKLRPIRIRVPGAIVIIEPNKRWQGEEVALSKALESITAKKVAA